MTEPDPPLSILEYAVYGVLCAARRETGPDGARRLFRIWERLDMWSDKEVAAALLRLIDLGWVRECDPVLGMIHYELAES